MNDTLIAIATIFSQLSLLAFGGGNTILPEMQRQVVDVHHWMSAHEFTALFALAEAAPGPNMMIVSLVGWHVAGWSGMRSRRLRSSGRRRSSPCSRCMRGSAFATGPAPLRAAGDDAGHRRNRRGQRGADLRGIEPHRDPVGHHGRVRGARVAHAHPSVVAARGRRADRKPRASGNDRRTLTARAPYWRESSREARWISTAPAAISLSPRC